VVGYAAVAFSATAVAAPTAAEKGAVLLKLARGAIAAELGHAVTPVPRSAWLAEPGASFVTLLTRSGELRGCIGSLQARRPLALDVQENAVAAAFHDPRFRPLTEAEIDDMVVEVSLLSTPEVMVVASEQDALARLRPGIDGVVLAYGGHRGTFLPQVWEQLPEPAEFLAQLKRNAGLPVDFWAEDVRLSRYTVSKWQEGKP